MKRNDELLEDWIFSFDYAERTLKETHGVNKFMSLEEFFKKSEPFASGGAYISPPRVQRSFSPRCNPIGELRPR